MSYDPNDKRNIREAKRRLTLWGYGDHAFNGSEVRYDTGRRSHTPLAKRIIQETGYRPDHTEALSDERYRALNGVVMSMPADSQLMANRHYDPDLLIREVVDRDRFYRVKELMNKRCLLLNKKGRYEEAERQFRQMMGFSLNSYEVTRTVEITLSDYFDEISVTRKAYYQRLKKCHQDFIGMGGLDV